MTTDAVGGVWTYALDLIEATRDLGVRFTLACLGPLPSAAQRRRAASLDNVRLECMECKLEWMDDPWDEVEASGEWLRSLEERDLPDIVHLNGYSHGSAGFRAPVLIVAHSCVVSWWRAVKGAEPPREWDEYRARVSVGLAEAARVVAPTAAMLAEVRRTYAPHAPCRVIHNGRSHTRPVAAPRRPMVASVGRVWDEAKNIGAVACVAPDLAWPCCVAGEAAAPDGRPVRFDNVRLLGAIPPEDVWGLLEQSSILAHPARYEPFGLAPLEAALAGCALVLGDIPSLREVWSDAALYTPPDDARCLSRHLRRLIDNERLRTEMAQRARLRARRYTGGAFGRSYASLYAEMNARRAHESGAMTLIQ
jgi:glycosyltransferase involved in cell wall biosynthesis